MRDGRLQLKKVAGSWNLADSLTKHLTLPEMVAKLERLGMHFTVGRSDLLDAI